MMNRIGFILSCLCVCILIGGCQSPYYADRGTAAGALGGAGIGALVGSATGDAGTGALIGAGVGAITGNAIGTALDDIEARNRAQIATQLGRPVAQGSATPAEVVAMSRAGVDSRLIVNYVNNSGVSRPINSQDVIYLHQQGVATDVIQAMQTPRVVRAPMVAVPPPVIVEEYHYGRPYYYGPGHHYQYHHGHHPRIGWGLSFHN